MSRDLQKALNEKRNQTTPRHHIIFKTFTVLCMKLLYGDFLRNDEERTDNNVRNERKKRLYSVTSVFIFYYYSPLSVFNHRYRHNDPVNEYRNVYLFKF